MRWRSRKAISTFRAPPPQHPSIHRLQQSQGMNLGLQSAHTALPGPAWGGAALAHLLQPGQRGSHSVIKTGEQWRGQSL